MVVQHGGEELVVDTGFGQALAHLRSIAKENGSTKGKLFEVLVRSFLKTDKLYTDRFDEVWMWDDYPDRDGPDSGIDLVAREKDGSLCAIQCKFYDNATVTKRDIDSFLEAGSRYEFDTMMLVYVGNGYGKTAQKALEGHNCKVLNFESLAGSNVQWPDLAAGITDVKPREARELWKHQEKAIDDCITNLKKHDKGKLIMACGTGKTLTSLRLAEGTVGKGGLVLYVVPSISLMRQAIRDWSGDRTIPHGYIGVCSDNTVSHGKKDIPIIEMEIGVSTDVSRIATKLRRDDTKMTVVFSTYQSMNVIRDAQKEPFDLILCDEAHRTTGVEQESNFQLVHSIPARKRIYMTATPKVYGKAAKTKASNANVELYSMDDDAKFGPDLHRLSFSDAIDRHLLVDYDVIVLGVSEQYGSKELQKMLDTVTDDGDINLTDMARMLGLYRILERPDVDVKPLQTAIAYTNRISDSKRFTRTFTKLHLGNHTCDARHVDGTQNSTERDGTIQWLRDSGVDTSECRIVCNARCLSEGIDIPALDAVAFLNPKSSEIDIIQAVGRVMRNHPGKQRGYIIIPLGIPDDVKPETILDNNKAFGVVWSVLRALRSHDSRLDMEVNRVDLTKQLPRRIKFIGIDREGKIRENKEDSLSLGELDIPVDALYSRIVQEVGDRQHMIRWAEDVADVVNRIQERIRIVIQSGVAQDKFEAYMAGLRDIIHSTISEEEGIGMLAQHLVTRRIFGAMFGTDNFAQSNPVSAALDTVLDEMYGLDTELRDLEKFYHSIEMRIRNLDTHEARQRVISQLYGTFFKKAFPKMASRLGIVYTPTEVVDFILRSVNHVLLENFGKGLTDEGVNVIDPFTGAGTFIARMMSKELDLIQDGDIERKYKSEIFANEIVLLAYYIAAINCESIYGQRTEQYKQFEGLSFTDTFNPGNLDEHTGDVMAGPKRRIKRQRAARITCIVGNPPYSAGQGNANEDNQNVRHTILEERIKTTYTAKAREVGFRGAILNPNNSYMKALRWASDRIGESGVIGFITPSSWLRGNAEAGIRACLQEEFTDVYCFDLRGNAHMRGDADKREGDKIFGEGSREATVIVILVKNPAKTGCIIHYRDIGDYLPLKEKLETIQKFGDVSGIPWGSIEPDQYHDWLNQRGELGAEWEGRLTPMGSKEGKRGKTNKMVFHQYSSGLKTHRDMWVYNTSRVRLTENMRRSIDYCNTQDSDNFIIDSKQAKWAHGLSRDIKKHGLPLKFDESKIRTALYRPFFRQQVYFDWVFINDVYHIPKFFPHGDTKNPTISRQTPDSENLAIIVPDKIKGEFSVFITDMTPDLEVVHHSQVFPMKVME